MLGPNAYGVPIARRSDGEVIATRCNKQNWVSYPLPKPKPRIGNQFKKTCFKPLGLFVISASLQCIQAFNHGADPWDLIGAREEASAVSVTYDEHNPNGTCDYNIKNINVFSRPDLIYWALCRVFSDYIYIHSLE